MCVPPCSDMENSADAYQYSCVVLPQEDFSQVKGLLDGQKTVRSSSGYVRSTSLLSSIPADAGVGVTNKRGLKHRIGSSMVVLHERHVWLSFPPLCYLTTWACPLSYC